MTGRELVTAALRLIRVVAPGESLAAGEASDALASLNRMLGSWSAEGLLIHTVTTESALTLTGGDATYTLGTSGNITTRPMEIVSALIRDGSTDYPVRLLTRAEYDAIPDKTTQSDFPDSLYDDGGYPQRTITLWPVPSSAKSLVLSTKRPLTEISTLDTSISLPPGYEDALTHNLALRLSPEYGKAVDPDVRQIASETKDAIRRANTEVPLLQCDGAVIGGGAYSIYTGGAR